MAGDSHDPGPYLPSLESIEPIEPATGGLPAPSIGVLPEPVAPPVVSAGSAAQPVRADRMATRNVPTARSSAMYGLPVQRTESVEPEEFVHPPLEPMGPPNSALLIGRGLMVVAMLLVGIAAGRVSGSGRAERAEAFWPVVGSAGVFAVVGLAGLVFWAVTLADNAIRLKARVVSPRRMVWSWLAPLLWIVASSFTYLRFEVDAEIDPLPGIAGVVFVALLAIAYAQLQGVFRGLSRRPLNLWPAAFLLDALAFGLVWWRLTSWPDPVTLGDTDHVRLTSYIAFGAAGALAVNALVFVMLAQRGQAGVYERLGRLEARHRGDKAPGPDWFVTGLQRQRDVGQVDERPLVNTAPLSGLVALFHVLWGVSVVLFGVAVAGLAFEYADSQTFDGPLALDQQDADRVAVIAGVVALVYVVTVIVHAVWSVLVAMNARRVTVHAPNPATFVIVFTPMPVLVVIGLLIGGTVGYWIVVAGLVFAFFAVLRVNQMLMSLSSRVGGELRGFSNWTALIGVAYLVGVAENLLITSPAGRLGFFATALLLQGALILAGGVVGFRAMRALEVTLSSARQVRREPASA